MELRDYQLKLESDIYSAWNQGYKNPCVQLSTGGGKTCIFSKIAHDHRGLAIVIAHRVEIISQISMALAIQNVRHAFVGSKKMVRSIVAIHMRSFGRSFYDPQAQCIVACVDTLLRRKQLPWMSQVSLVIQDEAHHVLRDNKWGKAAALFPQARGLYVTATPLRADGNGLGIHADGIMDTLIKGPPTKELINQGYLSKYRIFAPPCDINFTNIPISAGGDYSPQKLRELMHQSKITGDVVQQYLKIAPGKLGITFVVDIETAKETALAYRNAGVPAEVISSETEDGVRFMLMDRFKKREILQLVNVDLLGEGVDVPAVEVVSMVRRTESYALFKQQCGRALRPSPDKQYAIIIDHVGNTLRHGLPESDPDWSLDRRERRSQGARADVDPVRSCLNKTCLLVYERFRKQCPFCGHAPEPTNRSAPEFVDGDLYELSVEALNKLRNEVDRVDAAARIPQGVTNVAQLSILKNHKLRQETQRFLRESIALWAGHKKADGLNDSEICRYFYLKFGTDIMSAQALGVKDALELKERIEGTL